MNQAEVLKKTKIKPEEENTARRADLHLPDSKSDCSEERFTLPHLPAEATAVDSHPIIHSRHCGAVQGVSSLHHAP